jgi:hypothetical protein
MDAEVADDAAAGAEDKPTRGRGPARSDHVLTRELLRGWSAARARSGHQGSPLSAPKAISRARRAFEGQMRPLDEIEGVVQSQSPAQSWPESVLHKRPIRRNHRLRLRLLPLGAVVLVCSWLRPYIVD